MKKHAPPPPPSSLVAGILEDGERALFLCRKNMQGIETVEMPCVLLAKGENPVAVLALEFRRQTGIDAQVHEILFEKRQNIGSNRRKAWIPALAFKMTAKNASAKVAPEFSGYRWLSITDLASHKLAKSAYWLR